MELAAAVERPNPLPLFPELQIENKPGEWPREKRSQVPSPFSPPVFLRHSGDEPRGSEPENPEGCDFTNVHEDSKDNSLINPVLASFDVPPAADSPPGVYPKGRERSERAA